MKTILSLFDYSGAWSEPFFRNGWEVIQWDIKLDPLLDINAFEDCETTLDIIDTGHYDIQGIIAAVPCTEFAVSGSQYWKKKDRDGRTAKALQLVNQVQKLANFFMPTDPEYFEENPEAAFFWAMENPVGRLGALTGLDSPYYFNPCDFAGWLNPGKEDLQALAEIRTKNGFGVTELENSFVLQTNAYNKKTGLWGDFNRDMEKKRIEPVRTAPSGSPIQRLGGKSDRTKELRSNTPLGFAEAFYQANKNYQAEIN